MRGKERIASPAPERAWTRPEDYIGALARKRTFRRSRDRRQRTQPEAPQMLLSTLPFLALIGLLAVLGIAIIITAIPGTHPQPKPRQLAAKEQGVAERGWFQEAQKQFHK
jgi:hypothetical protein